AGAVVDGPCEVMHTHTQSGNGGVGVAGIGKCSAARGPSADTGEHRCGGLQLHISHWCTQVDVGTGGRIGCVTIVHHHKHGVGTWWPETAHAVVDGPDELMHTHIQAGHQRGWVVHIDHDRVALA